MVPDYAMNPLKKSKIDSGSVAAVDNNLGNKVLKAAGDGALIGLWFLLDHFADPNASNPTGTTALMVASFKGHVDVVRALLVFGADIDKQNKAGMTALMCASMNGQLAVVQQLLAHDIHAHVQAADDIHALIVDKKMVILRYGANINIQNKDGATSLILAAMKDQAEVTRFLLAAGANADLRDSKGKTAFDWAQEKGNQNVIKVFKEHFEARLKATSENKSSV
jgi:uncharacterized protein